MQPRIVTAAERCLRGLAGPLLAVSLCLTPAGSSFAAAPPAPAKTTYRIIQLSPDVNAYGQINAKGQVAFTTIMNDAWESWFYDGAAIHPIGTLGELDTRTAALNDLGQVVGSSRLGPVSQVRHAFIWSRSGGIRDLHPAGQETVDSYANDINNKGQVVGLANFPFRWSAATGFQPLATFGNGATPTVINDAGIVGGSALALDNVGDPMDLPVRWTAPNKVLALSNLGTRTSGVRGINAAGQMVGANVVPAAPFGAEHAFFWSEQQGLLPFALDYFSGASRINDKGMVIGSMFAPPYIRSFVWTRSAGLVEIGAGSTENSTAADLNNRNQVVGSIGDRAYVWSREHGVMLLDERVSGAPDGFALRYAQAISDNGAILATANTGLVLLVPHTASCNPSVLAPITYTGTPRINALLSFSARFRDADLRDTHKATWSWGDGSQEAAFVNSRNGAGSVSGQHAYRRLGAYTVTLTVTDNKGRSTAVSTV